MNKDSGAMVAEFLRLTRSTDDADRELVQRMVAAAASRHAELPALVRLAAIPRSFDDRIVSVLREPDAPPEETEQLTQLLIELPIVRRRQQGDYAIQHDVRKFLLDEWLGPDSDHETFANVNRRLAKYHDDRLQDMRRYASDLSLAATLLLSTNPRRYGRLQTRVDALESEPLLEELYHDSLRSIDAGYSSFTQFFYEYESLGRYTLCDALLVAMRDNLEGVPESVPRERDCAPWLDYWEARLLNQRSRYTDAVAMLQPLTERGDDDVMLKLWAMSELGRALQGLDDLSAAGPIFRNELELAEQTRVDPYNIPSSYSRLGSYHWNRHELALAENAYRESVRGAVEQENRSVEIASRTSLALVLAERGGWRTAVEPAIQALDRVWARADADANDALQILSRMMTLLRNDPAALDTVYEATARLLPAGSDLRARLQLDLDYMDALRAGGQMTRADAALTRLVYDAAGHADNEFLSTLLLRQGILREEQGELEAAIQAHKLVLDVPHDGEGLSWNGSAAVSNRGLALRDLGRWEEALSDFRVAREHWSRIGNDRLAAANALFQASVYERRHCIAAAESNMPSGDSPAELAEAHCLRGEVHRLHGRLADADAEYTRAIDAARDVAPATAARAAVWRSLLAALRANWASAAEQAATAASLIGHAAPAPRPVTAALAESEDLQRAQALLDEARPEIGDDLTIRVGNVWHVHGELARDRGQFAEAIDALKRTVTSYRIVEEHRLVGIVLADLADLEVIAGLWSDARTHFEELAATWSRLAVADTYRPSSDAVLANDENARGLRALFTVGKDRADKLRVSRDLLQSASKRCPADFWYPLNAAYAAAHLDDWASAVTWLDDALRTAPAWFPIAALHRRLVTFHLSASTDCVTSSEPDRALQHLMRARALLETEPLMAAENESPTGLWQQIGDGFLRLERIAEAESAYEECLRRLGSQQDADVHARIACRLALLATRKTASRNGAAFLENALALVGSHQDRAGFIARELGAVTSTESLYRCATQLLRTTAALNTALPEARRDVNRALVQLSVSRYYDIVMSERPDDAAGEVLPLLVTPLAVDAATSLYPADDDWTDNHPLFADYLPAMRGRVTADMGVSPPGVRFRADDGLESGGFRILLNETSVASGQVLPGHWYCPERAMLPDELQRKGADADGVWLTAAEADTAREVGARVWDVFEFIVRRLENVVRDELASFMDLQELARALDDSPASGNTTTLPDLVTRTRFVAVLRRLLQEAIPITSIRELLQIFTSSADEDVIAIAERARFALRRTIPATSPTRTFVRLAPDIEDRLAASVITDGHNRYISLDTPWASRLHAALIEVAGSTDPDRLTIVVEQASIRPFLRLFISYDFPHAGVVTLSELSSEVDLDDAQVIELMGTEDS